MRFFAYIIFGGIVGWLASLVVGTGASQGIILNIIVGILGAALGGWIGRQLGFGTVSGFNFKSFLLAMAGSVILLILVRWIF